MSVILAQDTATAIIGEVRRGARSEHTILFGEHAGELGFTSDTQAVKLQLERALSGQDPMVSQNVLNHVSGIHSTPMDLALLRWMGMDPGVVAFQVLVMGGLALRASGTDIQITSRMTDALPRMTFDANLGHGVTWSTSSKRTMVTLPSLPETLATMLKAEIEREGSTPLSRMVTHPLLDGSDLRIGDVRPLDWGGAWLTISSCPQVEAAPVCDLLGRQGG